jgi:hypothetical protein
LVTGQPVFRQGRKIKPVVRAKDPEKVGREDDVRVGIALAGEILPRSRPKLGRDVQHAAGGGSKMGDFE